MQIISDVDQELLLDLEHKRNWVRQHYTREVQHLYESVPGKLDLIDRILKNHWIKAEETLKLQSLGVSLGDIFVQDLKFIWVKVEDQFGIDAALQLPDTTIIVFPLTMISKRVERGEHVDIYCLYKSFKRDVQEIKRQAD